MEAGVQCKEMSCNGNGKECEKAKLEIHVGRRTNNEDWRRKGFGSDLSRKPEPRETHKQDIWNNI